MSDNILKFASRKQKDALPKNVLTEKIEELREAVQAETVIVMAHYANGDIEMTVEGEPSFDTVRRMLTLGLHRSYDIEEEITQCQP